MNGKLYRGSTSIDSDMIRLPFESQSLTTRRVTRDSVTPPYDTPLSVQETSTGCNGH